MTDRRVLPSILLAALAAVAGVAPAGGQPATPAPLTGPAQMAPAGDAMPSASDALLDKVFHDSTQGIEFRPPAGGILSRQPDKSEIARFSYPDRGWVLTVKVQPNTMQMPLAGNPAVPGKPGVLDVTALQLTDRASKPAVLNRKETQQVGANLIGLIEAHDSAGLDPVFLQIALVPDRGRYFQIQMTSKGNLQESQVRTLFQMSLATVARLDRAELRREQDQRLGNTRWLWLQLDEKRVGGVIDPLHFMRVVRDDHDIGYAQVNERIEQHHRRDGVAVIYRQHLESMLAPAAPAANAPAATEGLDLPQAPGKPAGGASQLVQFDRDARYFVSLDHAHEDWTTVERLNNKLGFDSVELGNSDIVPHRAIDRQGVAPADPKDPKQPHIVNRPVATLKVDSYKGTGRSSPPFAPAAQPFSTPLPPFYLPQAFGQLLPRLLPLDRPQGYLFAFYVSEQHKMMYRYVDVGVEAEFTLDGHKVRAVPIADHVGADGVVTTHYVDRNGGQWLGSVTDDGKLQVLPTDEQTLRSVWKGFSVLPEPPVPVDDDTPQTAEKISGDALRAPPPPDNAPQKPAPNGR